MAQIEHFAEQLVDQLAKDQQNQSQNHHHHHPNNSDHTFHPITTEGLQVITIRSKWEEFIVICRCSLFLEFEFFCSALFLHFNLKNCVENKVKAFPGLFDWPMQSRDTSAIT